MGRYTNYDQHHIIPKSRGGSNDKMNLTNTKHKFHVDFHRIFSNMTPDEQYQFNLKLNEKVHTKQFKKEFTDLINSANYENWMYNEGTRVREPKTQLELFK